MEIKLDTDTVKTLVSEAIMASLTSDKREVLIQNALSYLITPQTNHYTKQTESPIEAAFRQAIATIAREISTEMLTSDSRVREVIHKLITDAVERLLDPIAYNKTVERIKNAIELGLSER